MKRVCTSFSRRAFVKGLSAAGIVFTSCEIAERALGWMQAQTPASDNTREKRRQVTIGGRRVLTIDVHAHIQVPEVWDLIKDRIGREGRSGDVQLTADILSPSPLANLRNVRDVHKVDDRLAEMDAMGIDMQAVSINPFWYWADEQLARRIIQIQNEKIAELCAAHPDRFIGFGSVALQHPDLAVEQLDVGVKKLGMRGFAIGGSVDGLELSARKFDPVWAKAEELGTLIFIHPQGITGGGDRPPDQPRFQGNGFLGNVIGQPLETTLALSHLIQDGVLDRFPRLKICAAHGGGYLPSYAGRTDQCLTAFPKDCKPMKKTPSQYLKQLYYDSIVITAEGMRHLIAEVGVSQIVLGTDFPTLWNRNAVDRILEVPGLTDAQRIAMLGGTLAKVLRINAR